MFHIVPMNSLLMRSAIAIENSLQSNNIHSRIYLRLYRIELLPTPMFQ